jgi:glycosyltransferase involved in cell wall biosynthesis
MPSGGLSLAYLVNQYPQPSQSFIRREIRALEALGHSVHRFTVRRWGGKLVDEQDQSERERTRAILEAGALGLLGAVFTALLTRPGRLLRAAARAMRLARRADRGVVYHLIYLAEACVLLRWLKQAGVGHLHAHFGTNSATVALLTHVLGGPEWSFTAHGPEEFDRPEALHLGDKIDDARFVVAISDFGRSQLYRWCPHAQWPKIHIIRCGLDGSFVDQPATPIPGEGRLVCVGRLAEQKGQALLVEAAAALAKENIPFELTLVGDGPMRGVIAGLIAQHDLGARVRLAGWMSNAQVREALQRSRALVLPSFAEGLPVVIMEALALGRPVLSTAIAGIPELVRTGQTGWLIAPGNICQLAAAMREALAAPAGQLEQMGRSGAALVRERHRAAAEAEKLARLIERL